MEVQYCKFYQLGNGGQLIFERDLDTLSEYLEHPHPEFFGAQLNDHPGGDLQWMIVADLMIPCIRICGDDMCQHDPIF